MSNGQRFNWLQNQRVDVPHVKSMEDSAIYDFKSLLYGFVSQTPYILRGFNLINASNYINAQASTMQMSVADALVWMPGQSAGSFLYVPTGTADEVLSSSNTNVSGSFTPGSTNYVSIQLIRQTDPTTNDLVSFWDVDSKVEFTKTVPTGLVLKYQIVISTAGFGTNLPIAIVDVGISGAVTRIENAKQCLMRLGSGGASPDPYHTLTVSNENPLTVTANGQPDPFAGGDFSLGNMKAWMDMVMSQILSAIGGSFWYASGSSLVPGVNLSDLFWDTNASVITGTGEYIHDQATPGKLTWTSDITIHSVIGPLTLTIPAGNLTLNDTEVAYITLVRNQDFQPTNDFTFVNGSPTVSAVSAVSGISAGDYIKFANDDLQKWARVQSVIGNTVTLSANYIGSSVTGKAVRTQGTYTMLVGTVNTVPSNGNTYWFAKRSDDSGGVARLYLKGFGEIKRGEAKVIDDGVSISTLEYIGAPDEATSMPAYTATSSGSLNLPNYNAISAENLTDRLSKVTAMLADIRQDLNVVVDPGSVTWDGTTLGITSAQLSIPGTSIGAAPVAINSFSGALVANSAVYVDISRTSGSALTLASDTLANLTPSQQRYIIARNVGGEILLR